VPQAWQEGCVRLEFEAVFQTATVTVNGQAAGDHIGKGRTALHFGAANTLLVKVDNAFNDAMLPRCEGISCAPWSTATATFRSNGSRSRCPTSRLAWSTRTR
jgi:hypothetical protein